MLPVLGDLPTHMQEIQVLFYERDSFPNALLGPVNLCYIYGDASTVNEDISVKVGHAIHSLLAYLTWSPRYGCRATPLYLSR